MRRYKFFVVSKDGKFLMERKDFLEEIDTEKYIIDVVLHVNEDNQGLCRLYNSALSQSKDYDYIVFMHADVKLSIKGLIQHIESINGKYDVIGLCGCSKMSVGQSPLNWFTGSNPYPEYRWGSVTHGEIGNQTTFFNGNKEDTDHEVACIDGLCIVFSRKAADVLVFDEQFMFSHYDTDISFQCIFQKNLKLGVVVRTDLQHNSIGKSILTQEFKNSEQLFRKKWNYILNLDNKDKQH